MESQPPAPLNIIEQAPDPSNKEATNDVDATNFNEDDTTMQQFDEVFGDSPGARYVRDLAVSNLRCAVQETPTKSSVKILRPNSSGYDADTIEQFRMQAANHRPPQLLPPKTFKPQSYTEGTGPLPSRKAHKMPQSDDLLAKPDTRLVGHATPVSPTDLSGARSSPQDIQRSTTHAAFTSAAVGHEKDFGHTHQQDENVRLNSMPPGVGPRLAVQDSASIQESKEISFNFAPAKQPSKTPAATTSGNVSPLVPAPPTVQVLAGSTSETIKSILPETGVARIEVDTIGVVANHGGQPTQSTTHHEAITPEHKPHDQVPPPAPRAGRQTSVLDGRIAKRPIPNMGSRKPTPPRQVRPAATDASQPTEEDLLFLMMARTRRSKAREHALEASHEKLRAQLQHLQEENGTFEQQLAAADALTETQTNEIAAYKSQIENFKSRFTKFKVYAKELAQDYTEMGRAMEQIGNTTNELARDKVAINSSLSSLRKSSANASNILAGLRPKMSAAAQESGALQQALCLTEERLQSADSCLQYERVRNDRIETQILNAQQIQERLSLSSMHEFRKAAAYLDDLCRAVVQIGKTMSKNGEAKDTPGVFQCLNILQLLVEKQGSSITKLTEAKSVVDVISERLLSYHASADEATKAARNDAERHGRDVIAQITTSVGSLGKSVEAEATLTTLRGEVKTLQREVQLGGEMTMVANYCKDASEQREKEQAIRVDKLLEQLAEASKRQEQTTDTNSSTRSGLDANMLLTKYQQATTSLNAEQSKVNQKDNELYHKSLEVLALNAKLEKSQAESEASRSGMAAIEGRHEKLQRQADAAVQENIILKEKLNNLASTSQEAAKVPKLVEEIAEKDAKLAEMQPQVVKLPELVQVLACRDAELNKLRHEVARIPALVEDLTGRDTELTRVKLEAAKVLELSQQLVDKDTEILKLREHVSTMSELREKVVSKETELNELRPKAAQAVETASQNMVLQSQIHGYKNTIQALEEQLASLGAQLERMKQTVSEVVDVQKENTALKTEVNKVEQTIQNLESELRKAQSSAQEADDLKKEIATLRIEWGDHDQLKQDLKTQQDLHAKQVARLDELSSKLEDSQATSNQVTELQGQVEELCQKCAFLNQQLSEATQAAESCKATQDDLERKNEEIASLESKVQSLEVTSRQLIAAREESQQQARRLSALQEQITKLQLESQELTASTRTDIAPIDEDSLTQQFMLDLGGMLDQEDHAHASQDPAATLQSNLSLTRQHSRGDLTNRNSTRGSNNTPRSRLPSNSSHETEIRNSQQQSMKVTTDADGIQQIPDSQPQVNMRNLLATSSPLSEIETASYFDCFAGNSQKRRATIPHSLPPSSSYGGDSMLLEDFEAMEGMIEPPAGVLDQKAAASLSQLQSQKRAGYGHVSSRKITKISSTGSESRQVRTDLESQVIEETQIQEQRPSSPNMVPSSPAGPMKHLPNSAIKRPRLDPIEATPSTQGSGKRLRRTPANLDIAAASKRPMSSSTQITDPDSPRPTSVVLPSGGRKGSVIGANAPAPGKTRVSRKTSRKGSKSNRYTERFSNE